MSEDLSKIALMSGKLTGTKTLENAFESIKEPDEIELFLKEFIHLKIKFDLDNEVLYINDNQAFMGIMSKLEASEYVSLYTNDNFTSLYITDDSHTTYVVRIGKVSSTIIARLLMKEQTIKFLFHSFYFIKWCTAQKIEMRNVYDIPTYIKILTNEIDPFQTIESYIRQYTDYELKNDNNKTNSIIIGNFIYEFGKFLEQSVNRFNISSVCRLISENNYFEASFDDEKDNCTIRFKYSNIKQAIENAAIEKMKMFEGKEYIISPLGRIAIKFGHNEKELIEELYAEDISITILNELYNNNIRVFQDNDGNYLINCKYKNVGNVFSLVIAILDDVFYRTFEQTFEASISCEIS